MPSKKSSKVVKPNHSGRNQYSAGERTTQKKGPRRSRNILTSTLSGPAASAYTLETTIDFTERRKQLHNNSLGIQLRCLRTESSHAPVALVFLGTTENDHPTLPTSSKISSVQNVSSSSSSSDEVNTVRNIQPSVKETLWKEELNEIRGWQIDRLNGIPITPPTTTYFLHLLRSVPKHESVSLTFSHRPTDIVDIMYKSRYEKARIPQGEVSWEVQKQYGVGARRVSAHSSSSSSSSTSSSSSLDVVMVPKNTITKDLLVQDINLTVPLP